jgi:hypothetical protein
MRETGFPPEVFSILTCDNSDVYISRCGCVNPETFFYLFIGFKLSRALNNDAVVRTRQLVASFEKKLILKRLSEIREKSQGKHQPRQNDSSKIGHLSEKTDSEGNRSLLG